MPLSKAKQAEYMREYRKRSVIPNSNLDVRSSVIPKPLTGTPWIDDIAEFVDSASEEIDNTVQPEEINNIVAQIKALYPDGNLPNCPSLGVKDGRYRVLL